MNDFLENINDDKIRSEYFKTVIKSEFSIFTNKDEFVKYNKIVEKKLLKENLSVLNNVLDNIDNYHLSDKWKRNLIVSKITDELKNREKQKSRLSNGR